VISRGFGGLRVLNLLSGQFGGPEQAGEAEDGVHRGAYLLAHPGQEVRFVPGGLLGGSAGPRKLVVLLGQLGVQRQQTLIALIEFATQCLRQ
jgi:hypothetical protein